MADDAQTIADAVLARIKEYVIPATYPAEVGDWIMKSTGGRAYQWMFHMPLTSPEGIAWRMTATATGALDIEARDSYGQTFWRGTLVPAGGKAADHG